MFSFLTSNIAPRNSGQAIDESEHQELSGRSKPEKQHGATLKSRVQAMLGSLGAFLAVFCSITGVKNYLFHCDEASWHRQNASFLSK
jgi:hypothetical protein